ncbi:MAG TPA: proton-conducting transporter membrane subunit [Anaerolineales bacterium]|nr:proton-conducting transporter membrane subunit [Anaerolineales bacterium]
MSAPVVWILIPFILGILIFFLLPERYSAVAGGTAATILSLVALIFPIDVALLLGSVSLKISTSVQFFGRSFVLNTADGSLLAVIYGITALWFFGTQASGTIKRFVPLCLMIVALLTASIAVEPFLFAAVLIEIAAMLAIPLLVPPYQKPGKGVIRFLIYQTLAMPFILFSGWMLAGVEASPGDLGSTAQAGAMLGMGFAFLLGVFPLYNWIPMLMEESSPYVTGFLLWALPTFTIIFALGFLDQYTWIRNTPQLLSAIQAAGVFMAVSGGFFAAVQRHIGRMMGYAAIAEVGLIIVAMSLKSAELVNITFLLLIPRGLELVVWSLALSIIKRKAYSLRFNELQGLARSHPLTVTALILAHLSMTGFPLLAGFPSRIALWQGLAGQSIPVSLWIFLGLLGLLIASIRTLAVFVMAEDRTPWELSESWTQIFMLGLGVIGLFLLGMLPQILEPFIVNLPSLFDHLGQ